MEEWFKGVRTMKHFSLWIIGVFAFTFLTSTAEAQQVYGELKVVKGAINLLKQFMYMFYRLFRQQSDFDEFHYIVAG